MGAACSKPPPADEPAPKKAAVPAPAAPKAAPAPAPPAAPAAPPPAKPAARPEPKSVVAAVKPAPPATAVPPIAAPKPTPARAPPAAPPSAAGSVHLVVTGFGPFTGVPNNPAEAVVRALPGHLAIAAPSLAAALDAATILPVGAAAAEAAVEALTASASRAAAVGAVHVSLHVGVATSATTARLEAVAFNEASFHAPDCDGRKLSDCVVCDSYPPGARLMSTLPARAVAAAVAARGHPVQVSGDAGRFVCNYLYFRSLAAAAADAEQAGGGDGPRRHALFLHIPPTAVLPHAEAMALITAVLEEVVAAVEKA